MKLTVAEFNELRKRSSLQELEALRDALERDGEIVIVDFDDRDPGDEDPDADED